MDTVRRGATPTNTKRTYSRCALGRTQRRGHYAPSSGLHLVAARCRFWRGRFHAATLLSPRRRLRHVVGKSVCSGRSRELLTEAAIRAPQSLGCDIRMCPTCVPPSSALKCLTRFLPAQKQPRDGGWLRGRTRGQSRTLRRPLYGGDVVPARHVEALGCDRGTSGVSEVDSERHGGRRTWAWLCFMPCHTRRLGRAPSCHRCWEFAWADAWSWHDR